jgi:TonB family protein
MSGPKACIRCSRTIDAWAKICPYCNWDQNTAPPAQEPAKPAAVTDYRPPSEYDLKKKAIFAGVGALVLFASFAVGMVINSDDAPKNAPKTVEEQLAEDQQQARQSPVRRADTPLVPANEPGGIEQPITSAPVNPQPGAAPNDYQRSDATAVSATEYAELAKRAKAEKERMAMIVDPRSLTGAAYAQGQRLRRVAPRPVPQRPAGLGQEASNAQPPPFATEAPFSTPPPQAESPSTAQPRRTASIRTRPVPQYQPLPRISARGSARLSMIVGKDGRVKEVDIDRPLQGHTAELLRAVQSWRFKPATENGEPVNAPYTVEISFRQ